MQLLVTGGLGFIGSNFIRYILRKYPNYHITNLDKITYSGNPDNLNDIEQTENYTFVKGDICDTRLVNSLVKNVDGIIHFAAETHVDRSIADSASFLTTNIIGTQVLLNAAVKQGGKRFHHISTDEVFGALGKAGKFSEDAPYNPLNPYSASKAAADHLVRAYFNTYKLPMTISNCSNNYGPYQHPEKIIPHFITTLLEGGKVPLYGTGTNVRDWIHVNDHCKAIDLIYHEGKLGETYCIGSDCEKNNLELTRKILKILNFGEDRISFVEDRKGHDYRYAIDFTKIKNNLNWTPQIGFEDGLKDTITWYKNNTSWWKPLKRGSQ